MKVSIFGHGPEDFSIKPTRAIEKAISTLIQDYGDGLILLFNGQIGISQWVCDASRKHDIKYGIFIPCLPKELGTYWYEDQVDTIDKQFAGAFETYVGSMRSVDQLRRSDYESCNYRMVDGSNLVVAFWNGKKRGMTYDTIRHAFNADKMVVNALNEMSVVTKKDL